VSCGRVTRTFNGSRKSMEPATDLSAGPGKRHGLELGSDTGEKGVDLQFGSRWETQLDSSRFKSAFKIDSRLERRRPDGQPGRRCACGGGRHGARGDGSSGKLVETRAGGNPAPPRRRENRGEFERRSRRIVWRPGLCAVMCEAKARHHGDGEGKGAFHPW
jgi:hypothetical protein